MAGLLDLKNIIRTWHGSPHSWTRPDPMKVGTGEGGAAYGKGVLYSSDAKIVGEGYRNDLSPSELSFDGKTAREFYADQNISPMSAILLETALKKSGGNKNKAMEMLLDGEARYGSLSAPSNRKNHAFYGQAIDLLNDTPADAFQFKQGGHLYELGLDVNPNSLIDWQLPFKDQGLLAQDILGEGAEIAAKARKARADARGYGREKSIDEMTGEDIYRGLGAHYQDKVGSEIAKINQRMSELSRIMDLDIRNEYMRDSWIDASKEYNQLLDDREVLRKVFQDPDAAATQHLRDKGSSGITYMGENIRTGGIGARNYVSFNEDEIKVLNKYLRPETLVAPATGLLGATALTQSGNADAAALESGMPMAMQAGGQSAMGSKPDLGRDAGTLIGLLDFLLPLAGEAFKPATMGDAELTDEQRRQRKYYGQ